MNSKAINLIKNFSFTLFSNLVSMLISLLVTLVVPKLVGIEEYGYWQLYLLYSSFVGFLHFGWNDGIYLRYGGKEYKELDKRLFFSQFWMLVIFQVIILVIIYGFSNKFVANNDRLFILEMTALCMLLVNIRYMLLYILQGTNRIKEYAKIILIERLLFLFFAILSVTLGLIQFKVLIVADLFGKFISLLFGIYYCKDIVCKRVTSFYFSFRETLENINAGIKLMFAGIASLLIIGVVRLGIEKSWDVATFGKVSLTLSISNFLMTFINALGLVMYPVLKRADEKKLPGIYITLRDLLSILLFGVLIVYYPFKVILSAWLPNYIESLLYMGLLFPMVVYEGKMALLISTYLKSLRQEKMLLRVNLITLLLSILITLTITTIVRNLDLAVMSIVFLLAFRSILAEAFLSKILKVSIYKDILLELVITVIFIVSAWIINSWITVAIYGLIYCLYLFIKRKNIISAVKNIKILLRT